MYTEMPHQIEEHQHMFNDDEPSKMFTFEEGQQPLVQNSVEGDKQSQRSGRGGQQAAPFKQSPFMGAPSRTQ